MLQNTSSMITYLLSHKVSKYDEQDVLGAAGEDTVPPRGLFKSNDR